MGAHVCSLSMASASLWASASSPRSSCGSQSPYHRPLSPRRHGPPVAIGLFVFVMCTSLFVSPDPHLPYSSPFVGGAAPPPPPSAAGLVCANSLARGLAGVLNGAPAGLF